MKWYIALLSIIIHSQLNQISWVLEKQEKPNPS